MLQSLQGYKLLTGYRGAAGVDIESLIDTICRLSELANDLKDVIDEIDVNPMIVTSSGSVAADALVVTRR
jgi:acetyltransferase